MTTATARPPAVQGQANWDITVVAGAGAADPR